MGRPDLPKQGCRAAVSTPVLLATRKTPAANREEVSREWLLPEAIRSTVRAERSWRSRSAAKRGSSSRARPSTSAILKTVVIHGHSPRAVYGLRSPPARTRFGDERARHA